MSLVDSAQTNRYHGTAVAEQSLKRSFERLRIFVAIHSTPPRTHMRRCGPRVRPCLAGKHVAQQSSRLRFWSSFFQRFCSQCCTTQSRDRSLPAGGGRTGGRAGGQAEPRGLHLVAKLCSADTSISFSLVRVDNGTAMAAVAMRAYEGRVQSAGSWSSASLHAREVMPGIWRLGMSRMFSPALLLACASNVGTLSGSVYDLCLFQRRFLRAPHW